MIDFATEPNVDVLRAAGLLILEENTRLKKRIAELEARVGKGKDPKLEAELMILKDLVERQEQELYGPSSERRPLAEKSARERAPQRGHGPREQARLREVIVPHELPEDNVGCRECGGTLVPMGDQAEESERIGVLAREFVREVHKRRKYRCACNGRVATAPAPAQLVPGGRYTTAFAVHAVVEKYAYHMPFERQAQKMRREGLSIDAHTLWDQANALATVAEPTYEAIWRAILATPVIGADETPWPVLYNGRVLEKKSWRVWCATTVELVGYRILDGRGNDEGAQMLGDYRGVVMADGYAVYTSLSARSKSAPDAPPRFRVANCWAHVRRKFVECEANFPRESAEAIERIRALYEVEKRAKDLPPDERLKLRQTESKPIVEALFAWAESVRALPESGLGKALSYMLNLRQGLTVYLSDPLIPIDNNASERALRGAVLGRKNHLGSRSRRGTEVAAICYTLMESAKLADVDPAAYLLAVAEEAIRTPGAALLPAQFKARLSKT